MAATPGSGGGVEAEEDKKPNDQHTNLNVKGQERLVSTGDIASLDREYLWKLVREIPLEIAKRKREGDNAQDLVDAANKIVAFYMKSNNEYAAIDLALELGYIISVRPYVNDTNCRRVGRYITSVARYLPKDVRVKVLCDMYWIYLSFGDYPRALQLALLRDSDSGVIVAISCCKDLLEMKQLCFMIAQHGMSFVLGRKQVDNDEKTMKELQRILNNCHLCEGYHALFRMVYVMEPNFEDLNKVKVGVSWDPALQNLAATFANSFVNAGHGQENWVFKNFEHGTASATASLGMIWMWDDSGLALLDQYLHSNDNHVIAGALLGFGILSCRFKLDPDRALPILCDHVKNRDSSIRIGAILGLGLGYAGIGAILGLGLYAGSKCTKVWLKLSHLLRHGKFEEVAFAGLAVGLIFVGSKRKIIVDDICYAINLQRDSDLEKPLGRLLALGLGLLYLGSEDGSDAVLEVVRGLKVNETLKQYFHVTLLGCAYAGTGDVFQLCGLLRKCGKHAERGDFQAPAVLGIAMIAMGDDLSLEMAMRFFEHLARYGNVRIRRTIPLALGLLCISNAKVNVINTLSGLSHDQDEEVVMAAIISLGLIGAGTNNAKIAGMLRNLSHLLDSSETALFCIKVAQGLLYLGKGLLTIAPYHSERFLSPTALAGIITVLHACLNMKSFILGNYQFLLYFLALAMKPSMLMTVDENLKPMSVPVRVGKAVDVATLADQSSTITDFKTHFTPIILAAGERAELATIQSTLYIPLSPILEGYVILKEKNPAISRMPIQSNPIQRNPTRYIPLSPILEGYVILKEKNPAISRMPIQSNPIQRNPTSELGYQDPWDD